MALLFLLGHPAFYASSILVGDGSGLRVSVGSGAAPCSICCSAYRTLASSVSRVARSLSVSPSIPLFVSFRSSFHFEDFADNLFARLDVPVSLVEVFPEFLLSIWVGLASSTGVLR